jgi:hypothetical protein
MVLFLVFPFLALLLAMLCASALTFTVTAVVPAWRSFAIINPVAAFFLSPVLYVPLSLPIYTHIFGMGMEPSVTSPAFWIRFGTVLVLLAIGCTFVAYVAVLICQAIFQLVPPWLATAFGVRPSLLLQASILAGGSLSVVVLLTVATLLVYILKDNLIWVLLCGTTGVVASGICIRSLLRITEPDCYQPKPLSGWASRLLLSKP